MATKIETNSAEGSRRSSVPSGRLPIVTRLDSSSKESLSREILTRQSSTETSKCASSDRKLTPPVNERKKMMTNLPKRPPVEIRYESLTYTVPDTGMKFLCRQREDKMILKGVSGCFRPGELTAIMGPSGAGKSTLMNIMAGYKTSNVAGDIFINNKKRNLRKFRKMSCYIMQDDCLSPHLSVGEAMEVAASLKLGEKTSQEEKKLVIKEILDTLGLSECLNTRTSMISGGQRKRLAIALELVNNPPVMFFDEPTSGLDSASCFQCISLLKQLASEGRTIVCTIHQPSARIFEMFDKLVMLTDGQTIYRGKVSRLVPFLSDLSLECPSYHNPADFVMEVASGEYGEYVEKMSQAVSAEWPTEHALMSSASRSRKVTNAEDTRIEMKQNSSKEDGLDCHNSLLGSLESIDDHCHTFPTSTWTQFCILFKRTFFSIIRDRTLTQLRVVSHVAIGFLLGLLYWKVGNEASKVYNNSAMLFFCMLFSMFTAMMPTVMTFPMEMATFKREHLNYWYSMKSYYLAKVFADMPFQIIYPLVYVLIVYFMTAQPLDVVRLSMFVLMCILTSLVAQSIGLVIGCAVDAQAAVYLGPISTIPTLLFSGFFVSLDNIPSYMQWMSYVAYVRYGFEGTMLAIYGYDREKLDCSQPYCHFKYPKKFLEEMALEKGVFWIDVVSLIIFFVLLRVSGYFVLRFKLRSER